MRAQAPNATPEELQYIAFQRRDLWPVILNNPNVYPELIEWIHQQGGPRNQGGGKGRRGILWIVVAAVAVVAIVGGAATFFMFRGKDASASSFAALPQEASTVRVGQIAPDLRVVPLDGGISTVAMVGDTQVSRLSGDGTDVVVGLDMTNPTSYPLWVVDVPSGSNGCSVENTILDCGEDAVFEILHGAALPIDSEDVGGAARSGASSSEEKADSEADEGDAADVGNAADQGEAAGEGDTSVYGSAAETHVVGPTASDSVPYTFGNGVLSGKDGAVVTEDLVGQTLWALAVGDDDWWVFSDGNVLFSVTKGKIVWEADLPAGSIEVNGFQMDLDPSWNRSGDIVIIGTPQGLAAYSISSGEVKWSIEVPTTSYQISAVGPILLTEGSLVALEFPPEDAEAEKDADSPEGSQVLVLPETPAVVEVPTEEEVINMPVEVPADCLTFATGETRESHEVAFDEGVFAGTGTGTVTITHTAYPVLGGEPRVLLAFSCANDNGEAISVGLYDAQMGLLGEVEWNQGLSADSTDVAIEAMNVDQGFLIFTSGVWPAEIDPDCAGCEGYVTATSHFVWDGSVYVLTSQEFEEAEGPASGPDLVKLQALYQQLIDGDVESVRPYTIAQADYILDTIKADPKLAKLNFYADGSEIVECTPLAIGATSHYFPDTGMSIPFSSASPETFYGDYICGANITSRWMSHRDPNEREYYYWWMLRIQPNGDPLIYMMEGAQL